MSDPDDEARSEDATYRGHQGDDDDESFDDEVEPTRLTAEDEMNGDSPAEQRLRGLVTYIASNLVDHPDEVDVISRRRGQTVHLTMSVPHEELGKVIGRQGRIARAIRTAVLIAGSREDVRATLDIESEA